MKISLSSVGILALKLIASVIMLQTLYYKFTGQPESIYIFTKLGMEPWGRIGIGVFELIASILILIPRTTVYGALLGIGLMGGAVFFHITKLGLIVQDDGGQLFIYCLLVLLSCIGLVIIYRNKLCNDLTAVLKTVKK
ncbi:MAG TPA: DoxX family protein [Ferruginibacter sp.]|nr:DoxX family protein [Ferruginibacter sp.]